MKKHDRFRPFSTAAGFTLLEILLAVFIFAVVAVTIQVSYTGTLRLVDTTTVRAAIYRRARIAMQRLSEDLQSAYYLPGPPPADEEGEPRFQGVDADIGGRDSDSLQFFSRAHLVFGEQEQPAGQAVIRYQVVEDEENGGLLLLRDDRPVHLPPAEEAVGYVLCSGLRGVNFTYYDTDGDEYERWDSESERFDYRLPAMVEIRLAFAAGNDPATGPIFMTRVSLPQIEEAGGQ